MVSDSGAYIVVVTFRDAKSDTFVTQTFTHGWVIPQHMEQALRWAKADYVRYTQELNVMRVALALVLEGW